jgi:hypothetical protein
MMQAHDDDAHLPHMYYTSVTASPFYNLNNNNNTNETKNLNQTPQLENLQTEEEEGIKNELTYPYDNQILDGIRVTVPVVSTILVVGSILLVMWSSVLLLKYRRTKILNDLGQTVFIVTKHLPLWIGSILFSLLFIAHTILLTHYGKRAKAHEIKSMERINMSYYDHSPMRKMYRGFIKSLPLLANGIILVLYGIYFLACAFVSVRSIFRWNTINSEICVLSQGQRACDRVMLGFIFACIASMLGVTTSIILSIFNQVIITHLGSRRRRKYQLRSHIPSELSMA